MDGRYDEVNRLIREGPTRIPMSARVWVSGASLFALWCVAAPSADAQAQPAPGVIDGVVTDTSLAPLADATASILGSEIRVTTGSNGRFRVVALPPGDYVLMIRRLGYAPSSTVAHVAERDTLRASFTLERLPTKLDAVVVVVSHPPTRMAEFEERRKRGEGQFMTQAEIEKVNEPHTSDLLGRFTNRRARCVPQFFVDGVAIRMRDPDADLPTPKEIAGIEVYTNSATIPLQYKTMRAGGFCGVVLVWTR